MQSRRRISFRHELEVLSGVLRYYGNYVDDPDFHFPVKKRHRHAVKLNREKKIKPKNLTNEEFWRFHAELSKSRYGTILAPLAIVQYFQALRVSEVGAIFKEDVILNTGDPRLSRLLIRRHVIHTRRKGEKPYIKTGFKNSKSYGPVKELPLFPEAYDALVALALPQDTALIFHIQGEAIPYRTIQHYFDRAFRAAELPYTATHVMRHGRTRQVYNQHPDMDCAKQLLGDKSDSAARVYAVRNTTALNEVSDKYWELHTLSARNCPQIKESK